MKCEICDQPIKKEQPTGYWFGKPAHRLCAKWGNESNEKFRRNIYYVLGTIVTFLLAAWLLPQWSALVLIPLWYWAAWQLMSNGSRPTQEEIENDRDLEE